MSRLLKYAIFLALAVVIGFYILFGPTRREDIAFIPVQREAAVIPAKSEAAAPDVKPASTASIDEELDYLVAKRLGSLAGWRAFLAAHASGAYAQSARAEVEKRLPTENAAAEAAVATVAAPASASIDEERDYVVAQRLGSLEGWRGFLATHGSSVYAQSARAEVERLLLAEKAPASAAAEVPNGASTDASAASEAMGPIPSPRGTEVASGYAIPAPAAAEVSNDASADATAADEAARRAPPLAGTDASAGTEVAALTPDEVCKRDGDRLARLGSSPSSDEAARFANEFGCEKLRPQVLALMESSGYAVPAPAAADVSNGASPDAKPMSEAARPAPPAPAVAEVSNDASPDAKPVSEAARPAPPILPFRGTEVAALTSDGVCKRDGDRLARLRSNPSSDEAARFANELGCEKLRPQVLGLMESLAHAVPAPAAAEVSNDASPDAKAADEAARPASPLPGTDVAALTPDETCKRDGDRLARLRGSPSGEEAQRFANELACERLRPQLQRLMESLGFAPAPAPADSSPADSLLTGVCASQRAGLDRLRKEPSAEAAQLFWRDLQCERLRPQVRLLLESLNLTPEALGSAATPDAPTPKGADPVACRRETAELNQIRAAPNLGDAKRFASIVTCDVLKPQAARLLESLTE
jgi:hypothetical protein